ncbi:MAG: ATP-binding protein [Desulfovibrio sp.]|nr:ATP-binding protein [Desulfovibrio sp.]
MSALQQLPLGAQSFKIIRQNGDLYVDKTRYLPELRKMGSVVFCARPRRFGKSLTVSALEAFYGGKKELFQGLAVEEYMNSAEFQPRPVIKLDMSAIPLLRSIEAFQSQLLLELQNVADLLGVKIRSTDPSSAFRFLMQDLAQKSGKPVVVLIDEYDAPVLNSLSKPALLKEVREVMRGFYTQIKVASDYVHFAFITGVSKFSKMGVFSSLNNLYDISLDHEFAAMMGYTHEEFGNSFQPYLEGLSKKTGIAVAELPEKIEEYYNGFSFDGETLLYNPFSTLSLLQRGFFDNYWMESGSTSFIRNFLREKKLTVEQFRNLPVQRSFLTSPGEIESTPPHGFLYQAGYLTLRKGDDGYCLDYPNFEVLSAMSAYCIQNMIHEDDVADELFKNVQSAVANQDAEALVKVFNRVYAAVSYDDYRVNSNESFYRATLQTFLLGAGIRAQAEVCNNLGRMDIVARYNDKTVVIELKRAADAEKAVKAAVAGMSQMLEKQYGNAYADALRLAVAIDDGKRRIVAYNYIPAGFSTVKASTGYITV